MVVVLEEGEAQAATAQELDLAFPQALLTLLLSVLVVMVAYQM